MEDSWLWLLHT